MRQGRWNLMVQTIVSLLRFLITISVPKVPSFLAVVQLFFPSLHFPSLSLCLCLLLYFSLSSPPLSASVSLSSAICSSTCSSFYLYTTFSCREIWSVLSLCHSLLLPVHPSHTTKAWLRPSSVQHRQ